MPKFDWLSARDVFCWFNLDSLEDAVCVFVMLTYLSCVFARAFDWILLAYYTFLTCSSLSAKGPVVLRLLGLGGLMAFWRD